MIQKALAATLVTLLLINITWQQESLILSNSALEATELGVAESLVQLLVGKDELLYSTVSGQTVNSIAASYYGSSSFALLIVRANAAIDFQSTTTALPVGTSLRLPSVLLCPQFAGIDCVRDSYHLSLPLPEGPNNYWKSLDEELLNRVAEAMEYPNYITFIMSVLKSEVLNPPLNLTIQIANYASADLTNGKVAFTTGFGKTPAAVIPMNSVYTYTAQRSDLLQGIHGTLSYTTVDANGQSQAFDLTFNVYAGNGSFWNTFSFAGQVQTGAPTSQNSGFRNLQIGSQLVAWASITESPGVQLNIVLEPIHSPVTFNAKPQIITSHAVSKLVLEGVWNNFLNGYTFMSYTKNSYPWQAYRFLSLGDGWKHRNQFRLINQNNSYALEADEAQSIPTFRIPDENNQNQVWTIVPYVVDGSKVAYQIRSNSGKCLHLAVDTVPRNPVTSDSHEIWLEKCGTTSYQKWVLSDANIVYKK